MIVRVDDCDYVGNHVYNYLREYLYDNVGLFYIEQSKKPNLICRPNEIIWQSQRITFPTPYGQFYCFYDETVKHVLKDEYYETIYIMDLCKNVVNMILNRPVNIVVERFTEIPAKDRLNKNSKFGLVRNGFGDNMAYYARDISEGIFTVVLNNPAHKTECGQLPNNLLKFKCNRVLTSPRLPVSKRNLGHYDKKLRRMFLRNNSKFLLESISEYKYPHSKIIGYSVLGIRFFYVSCNPVGQICSNSFVQLKYLTDGITDFIRNHDKLVLMIDDWRFLRLFIVMFYDILQKKRVVVLNNIGTNDVHELLRIGINSKNFFHTYSEFYTLMDSSRR